MIYMINQIPDLYRWVSVVKDKNDWGIRVSAVKGGPVGSEFGPVPVEWTPETVKRAVCDFPNFRPNLLCISRAAADVLGEILMPEGESINLHGLDGQYIAYHCLTVVDALRKPEGRIVEPRLGSFHSPRFAPDLRAAALPRADIFRIPESVSKLFVSQRFKTLYENNALTGLDFIQAAVTAI
jgi:hypothetical protein